MLIDGRTSYSDEFFTGKDDAEVAILPVSYDKTSTWSKGACRGPFALLEAFDSLETYDHETGQDVSARGIFVSEPIVSGKDPENMVKEVEGRVSGLISSGKFVVTVGGEHSVSVGAINAHLAGIKDVSVLQLDAHADLRDEYRGSRFNHACVMARAIEKVSCVQVGIRSIAEEETGVNDPENMFFAKTIAGRQDWYGDVIERLPEKVYVTIDLDVFDPGIMPATGTPQPGGLDWYSVLGFLREVSVRRDVIGFDIVELCPIEGLRAPEVLAAKLLYKFLGYIYNNRNRRCTE